MSTSKRKAITAVELRALEAAVNMYGDSLADIEIEARRPFVRTYEQAKRGIASVGALADENNILADHLRWALDAPKDTDKRWSAIRKLVGPREPQR